MSIKSVADFIKSLKSSVPAPLNAFLYLTGIGSKSFVENIKLKFGIRAKGRKVGGANEKHNNIIFFVYGPFADGCFSTFIQLETG